MTNKEEALKREFKTIHMIFMDAKDINTRNKALDMVGGFVLDHVPGAKASADRIAERLRGL